MQSSPPSHNPLDRPQQRYKRVSSLNKTARQIWRRDPARGLSLAQEAYSLAMVDPVFAQGVAEANLNLGRISLRLAHYSEAQSHLLQALAQFQELKDQQGEAHAWTNLGLIHWRLADYPTASEYHQRAIEIFRSIQDIQGEAAALGNLGLVYGLTGDNLAAQNTYQKLLKIFKNTGDRVKEGYAFNNLAMTYQQMGELRQAYACAMQGLQIAQEEKHQGLEASLLDTHGIIVMKEGDTKRALAYFQSSANLAAALGFQHDELSILLNVGQAYAGEGQFPQALETWRRAQDLGEKLGAKEDLRKCHALLAQFYKEQGDLAAALDNYERFHQLDKEIFNETADMRLKTLQVSFEVQTALQRNTMLEREIAERRQAEAALQASEERLRMMVQHMPVLIDAFDEKGNIVFWNEECARVTGYSAAEIINNPQAMAMFYPDEAYPQQMLRAWREKGNDYRNWEWEITCKDGNKKTIAWSDISKKFPLPGWAAWGVGVDVTERQRAEAALRQAQKMESLGVLAGGVAHDFNNLLVAMLGQISLAAEKLQPEHQARPHVERAVKAAERAADLTRKMLAYSGRGHFSILPLDLNALIEENMQLFRVSLPQNVSLLPKLTPGLPLIEADAGQMQQVIMNLIINGAEAIGEQPGQILVATREKVITADSSDRWQYTGQPISPGRYVTLEVHDSGTGMDAQTLANMFDPFFTTKQTGHGLGLPTVLGVVRGHRGGILVRSVPDQGTTFELLFPASLEKVEKIATKTAVPLPPAAANCVLIIDDEEPVRQAITDILDLSNIKALTAPDGQTGLEIYRQFMGEIQLVILDLSMPGLSGEETFHLLRRLNPQVSVLLSSGFSQAEVTQSFLGQGLAGFIQKPYNAMDLLEKVSELLGVR